MNDAVVNQTQFLQEGPGEPKAQDPSVPQQPVERKTHSLFLLMFLVVCAVLLVVGVLGFSLTRRSKQQVLVPSTPAPTQVPVETSGIRREITTDLEVISASNPENAEYPFPPVDFSIRIKDPSGTL